jgi:virulence-associated protein VapD
VSRKCQGDGSSDKTFDIDYVNNTSIAYSDIDRLLVIAVSLETKRGEMYTDDHLQNKTHKIMFAANVNSYYFIISKDGYS